jgi:hypothetical protein
MGVTCEVVDTVQVVKCPIEFIKLRVPQMLCTMQCQCFGDVCVCWLAALEKPIALTFSTRKDTTDKRDCCKVKAVKITQA